MLKDSDYVLIHSRETMFENATIGLRIMAATGRPITDQEKKIAYRVGDQMFKEMWRANVLQDEEMAATAAKEKASILKLFEGKNIFVEEIPNGYCSDPCCSRLPWFMVTTSIGHIMIGWRKRVINIDWTKTLQKKNGSELFPKEEVTKSNDFDKERYIHAWGYEKAKEYLDILHG